MRLDEAIRGGYRDSGGVAAGTVAIDLEDAAPVHAVHGRAARAYAEITASMA
jgi:hypothetical protein